MLGQIVYSTRRLPTLEEASLHGLPIARVAVDPDSFWTDFQLRRAGKLLQRAGVRRALAPPDFTGWPRLEQYGVGRMDPGAFLQSHAAPLSLALLRRSGKEARRCAVALRGQRAGRTMLLAAEELCQRVREVCISAPVGGEQLREHLRWEYGLAVRPDFEGVEGAARFHRDTAPWGACVAELFPGGRGAGEVKISCPGLDVSENGQIALLAALWEGGKLERGDLEFT